MSPNLIETYSLTRRFGRLAAVDDLELRVPEGSIYGFLGPNGAGKTTTIRMLLGLIRPSAGRVYLFERPLGTSASAALARTGSLVEAPAIYPHLTGRENLELIRRLRDGTAAQVGQALAVVGLEDAAGRPAATYSLGMIQRLGLAIALMGLPPLLILDEPTNGLDPAGIREMRELIRRLPGEYGVTVFVSSHLLGEVEQMATHIGIIRAGRLLFQGTPDELRARYQDHITLRVDRPEAAARALRRAGWQVREDPPDGGTTNEDFAGPVRSTPVRAEGLPDGGTMNEEQSSVVHSQHGWPSLGRSCAHDSKRALRVDANGEADAALLLKQLVAAGHNVYHAALEQPSLEEIFLQLTAAPAPGALAPAGGSAIIEAALSAAGGIS